MLTTVLARAPLQMCTRTCSVPSHLTPRKLLTGGAKICVGRRQVPQPRPRPPWEGETQDKVLLPQKRRLPPGAGLQQAHRVQVFPRLQALGAAWQPNLFTHPPDLPGLVCPPNSSQSRSHCPQWAARAALHS